MSTFIISELIDMTLNGRGMNVDGWEDAVRNCIANIDERLAEYEYKFNKATHRGIIWLLLRIYDVSEFFTAVDEVKLLQFCNGLIALLDLDTDASGVWYGYMSGYVCLVDAQPFSGECVEDVIESLNSK